MLRATLGVTLIFMLAIVMWPAPDVGAQARGRNRDYTEMQRTSDEAQSLDNKTAIQRAIASGRAVRVVVRLSDPPLASYEGGKGPGRTKPTRGQKLDLQSSNAQEYTRYLAGKRGAFITWLRSNAPGARVDRQFKTVLNGVGLTVGGRDLAAILRAPGVRSVSVSRRVRPLMNVSRGLIGAPAVDALLGAILPGQNMRIGIIDTGILDEHPFFDPTGYVAPAGFPVADNAANLACCTSAKVIVARAYPDPALGGPDSAVDTNGHGSHVAGTAAGNAGSIAVVQGVSIPGLAGVAHRAYLGNYNVFPNGQVEEADLEVVVALEDAIADGMDAVNMSLGNPACCLEDDDPLTAASNAAVDAGLIVAISAGNDGPGLYTIGMPGMASKALTSGASTNPHFVGQPVSGVHSLGTVGGAVGDFNAFPSVAWSWLSFEANLACDAATIPAPTADPQIAVIRRGACTFTTKIRNAQNAGYDGVIVRNNSAGDPTAMGHDGTDPFPTIPAIMIQISALVGTSGTATISATFSEFITSPNLSSFSATPNADIIAGFSSRGPVPLDHRLKPDFTAPGVNVLSAVNSVGEWAFFQGTSMSSPHIAGAATLLKQLHPSWTVADIKSSLVTLAKRPVYDHLLAANDVSPLVRGGGRINLAASKDASASFDPSVVSFKEVSTSTTVPITLKNVGSGANSWTISVVEFRDTCGSALPIVPSPASTGSLPAGASTVINVTATNPGYPALCMGDIVASDGAQTHRLPFLARFAGTK